MSTEIYEDLPPKSGKIIKTGDGIVDEGQTIDDNAYPTAPATTSISLITAADEKTYSIPAGTKQIAIKLRGTTSRFTYAWSSGQLTAGEITIEAGVVRTIRGIRLGGLTLFITAPNNSQVFEIETWA